MLLLLLADGSRAENLLDDLPPEIVIKQHQMLKVLILHHQPFRQLLYLSIGRCVFDVVSGQNYHLVLADRRHYLQLLVYSVENSRYQLLFVTITHKTFEE